jgi:hypothetical protein
MGTLLLSLLTFSLPFDARFTPIGGRDGVEVYQNQRTSEIELAALGEFDAPVAEVQAALLDYGGHVRINKHLAESTVLSRNGSEMLVYQHLKLPVVKDRDFTLHVTWAGQSVSFRIDPSRGPAPSAKAVRMSLLVGRWDLEPIRGGTATRAVYRVRIDFAGSVPRWMVRGGAAKDIPGVYSGMRTLILARRAHAGTKISFR